MRTIDPQKLEKLSTVNEDLNKRHGMRGTAERNNFDENSFTFMRLILK